MRVARDFLSLLGLPIRPLSSLLPPGATGDAAPAPSMDRLPVGVRKPPVGTEDITPTRAPRAPADALGVRHWPHGQLIELLTDCPADALLSPLADGLAALGVDATAALWVAPLQASNASRAIAVSSVGAADASRVMHPSSTRGCWWTLEHALRDRTLAAVIGWLPDATQGDGDYRALRRLQSLASGHQPLLVLLRSTRHLCCPSPAALRLLIDGIDAPDPSQRRLRRTVVRRRGCPFPHAAATDAVLH